MTLVKCHRSEALEQPYEDIVRAIAINQIINEKKNQKTIKRNNGNQ